MSTVNEKNTSTVNIVIVHYITAAIMLVVIMALMCISGDSFVGHYFQPRILAITHLTTLGWVSMIIFGALYQLVPVIINAELFSIKLSIITYLCFITGTLFLAFSFWYFAVGLAIQLAALILCVGTTLFVVNIFLTTRKSIGNNVEMDFILSAVFWFWLTVLIGTLMAYNLTYDFLPKEHLYYLKIHAHIGLLGWFLLLIIGVSSKLIPMFLLSGNLDTKRLHFSFYILHIGLFGFVIDSFFFNGLSHSPIYLLLIVSGIVFYVTHLIMAYKKRARKNLDIGLRHSFIALLFIAIPIILTVLLNIDFIHDPKLLAQISIAFGFSVLYGFISLLILGQTFKTLPFMVWLKKYEKFSGKIKIPLPKDLYSEKLANAQLILFITGYLIVLTGILTSHFHAIQSGSFILLVTAIIYNINIFKIVFHKAHFL